MLKNRQLTAKNMTEVQRAIARELTPMIYYSGKQAQADLDRLTHGKYDIDGDTFHGYVIREGNVIVIGKTARWTPRSLVILAVELYRNETL